MNDTTQSSTINKKRKPEWTNSFSSCLKYTKPDSLNQQTIHGIILF